MKSTFALPEEVFEEKISEGELSARRILEFAMTRALQWTPTRQAQMRLAPAWSKDQLRELLDKLQELRILPMKRPSSENIFG
jgi:hypothetical protein